MAPLKTRATDTDPRAFIEALEDPSKKEDCYEILAMMEEITGAPATMWGSSIIGFGSYHYRYESGREGDWFLTGFSPRKQNLSLYIMSGFENYESLMEQLGQYKTGKACLYIKRLADVDRKIVRELIHQSCLYIKARYA